MNPQTYVIVAIGSATLIVAGARIARGELPNVRVFIGGTIAALLLSVTAGPLPGLSRGLASLAILGAVLSSGYALAEPLARVVTGN